MKLLPVILLVSLVLVACLQVSSCAKSSLVPSPNPKLPFRIRSDGGIDIYHIKGILNQEKVMYPGVLISKQILVAATGDPIESPMICLGDDCAPPKHFVYQRHYAFWVRNSSSNDTKVAQVFTGNITTYHCALNDRNVPTTFKHVVNSKDAYTCIGQCEAHDVVVCDNKVAGFLEKTNKPNTFIFRDITNILQDYTTLSNEGYHSAHVKLFTVKFCGNHENKQERRAFAAIAIDANTLVSYRWIDISGDKVKVCGRYVCFPPSGILKRNPYIFWKTNRKVSANTIRFFRGDITKAKCSLNGITHNVTFKSFSTTKRQFTCEPGCTQSDFVLCNGKMAGFLTETLIKNVFKLDTMARVMKFAGHFSKINGTSSLRRPKLPRQKRRLKPNDAPITTKNMLVQVTQAGNKSSDKLDGAVAAAAASGGRDAGGANASKEKERKTSKNRTNGEKRGPSEAKDISGTADVQKSTSESKDRKGAAVTKNIIEDGTIEDEEVLRSMEGDDEEEEELNPQNQEGRLPDMPLENDDGSGDVSYIDDEEDDEDVDEEEVPRIAGRIPEDELDSDKEQEVVEVGASGKTKTHVVKPTLPQHGSTDDFIPLQDPKADVAVRDALSVAGAKASCILINVPIAIVFLLVNV